MMLIIYKKSFKKSLAKQPLLIQNYFKEKLFLFTTNPQHPSLRAHYLKGKLSGLQSFDVTADVRVHFYIQDGIYILMNIGTHNEFY